MNHDRVIRGLNRLLSHAHREGKHDANLPLDSAARHSRSTACSQSSRCAAAIRRRDPFDHAACRVEADCSKGATTSRSAAICIPAEDRWIRPTLETGASPRARNPVEPGCVFPRSRTEMRQRLCCRRYAAIAASSTNLSGGLHFFANAERCLHPGQELRTAVFTQIPGYTHAPSGCRRELNRACRIQPRSTRLTSYPKRNDTPRAEDAQSWLRQARVRSCAGEMFEHSARGQDSAKICWNTNSK